MSDWETIAKPAASGDGWETIKPKKPAAAPKKEEPGSGFVDFARGLVEAPMAMASGAAAKPIADVAGLAAGAYEGMFGGPQHQEPRLGATPEGFRQHIQENLTYRPRTKTGQALTEYNPLALIGKGVDKAGGAIESGINAIPLPPAADPARRAVASGVHEAVNQAPSFIGAKTPGVMKAAGEATQDLGRATMQSALKPNLPSRQKNLPASTGMRNPGETLTKAEAGVETLLQEGVNVSKGGARKLDERIQAIDDRIANVVAQHPQAMVDKGRAASVLSDLMRKFEKQVNPKADLAKIADAWTEFMSHPLLSGKQQFPIKLAQELKSGTYRALKDKAYGELGGAEIEAQKALARGLKEEIERLLPDVRPLSTKESQLINALNMTERRILQSANRNPLGLGALFLHPKQLALWMADRSDLFKSLVARMLYSTGGAMKGAGQTAMPLAGMAVTEEANRAGMPPPPQGMPQ